MTELELNFLVAVSVSVLGLLFAAGGALWMARHDNVKPHTPPGE